jgi:5'-3' exonuclease
VNLKTYFHTDKILCDVLSTTITQKITSNVKFFCQFENGKKTKKTEKEMERKQRKQKKEMEKGNLLTL